MDHDEALIMHLCFAHVYHFEQNAPNQFSGNAGDPSKVEVTCLGVE